MMKKRIICFTIFILLSCIGGCVTIYNPATQRKESYFIDDKAEVALGRNVAQDILRNSKISSDSISLSNVRKIGEKVARVSDRNYLEYKFYLLADQEINAFALPGGYVFVNSGLVDKATNDELAFVLGHEIGHICARHSVKRMQVSLGMSLLLNLALRNPDHVATQRAVNLVYNIIALGYSRGDEILADSLGLKYACQAGYGPEGVVSLLEKLQKENHGGRSPVFLSSHPAPKVRIKNIKEKIKELQSTAGHR